MLVEFALPYTIRCIPRRRRREVEEPLHCSEHLEIAECSPVDAPVAFIVHRSRHPRTDLAVRSYGGGLWWPLLQSGLPMTGTECIDALRDGPLDMLGLLPRGAGFPERSFDDLVLRKLESSARATALAQASRKARHLLFCEGIAYGLGGPPLHVVIGSEEFVDVASAPAPGVAIDPLVAGLRTPPGRASQHAILVGLSEGLFFAPGGSRQHLPVLEHGFFPAASVEFVQPLDVRVDADRLRFDACCRRVWQVLHERPDRMGARMADEFDEVKFHFDAAAAVVPVPLDGCARALSRFIVWASCHDSGLSYTYRRLCVTAAGALAVMRRDRPGLGMGSPPLAPEDDDAVATLASDLVRTRQKGGQS